MSLNLNTGFKTFELKQNEYLSEVKASFLKSTHTGCVLFPNIDVVSTLEKSSRFPTFHIFWDLNYTAGVCVCEAVDRWSPLLGVHMFLYVFLPDCCKPRDLRSVSATPERSHCLLTLFHI